MKKLFIILILLIAKQGYSQEIYQSLIDRYNTVDYIFEGKVLQTNSYLTADGKNIYTSNVIEVAKIFKGNISCGTIELITDGGTVGDLSMYCSHCLSPYEGQVGLFLCTANSKELPVNTFYSFTIPDKIAPTFEWQSFIQYQYENGGWAAYDLWQKFNELNDLYNLTSQLTGLQYLDCGYTVLPPHHRPNPLPYRPDSITPFSSVTKAQFDAITAQKRANAINGNRSQAAGRVDFALSSPRLTGSAPRYFEFDVEIGADAGQYLAYADVRLKYDATAFGSHINANHKVTVTRGSAVTSTTQYPYTLIDDDGSDVLSIDIADGLSPTALTQFNPSKEQLFHVKIELANCGTGGNVQFIHSDTMRMNTFFETTPSGTLLNDFTSISAAQTLPISSCSATVTSFDPLIVNGGVREVLNIHGYQFGASRGAGNLYFYNADNPITGMSVALEDSDYILWSDTLIKIYVPSVEDSSNGPVIGTGRFRITTNALEMDTTRDSLTVFYSLQNDYQSSHRKFFTYLYNASGNGGYQFFVDTSVSHNPDIYGCVKKALKDWICATGVNFALLRDTFGLPNRENRDQINLITIGHQPPNVLATCYHIGSVCLSTGIGVRDEIDLVISDITSSNWFIDTTGSLPVPFGKKDLYHVLLHELGHGIGHNHVIDSTAIMYYLIPAVPASGLPANQRVVVLTNDLSAVEGGQWEVNISNTSATILNNCSNSHPMITITSGRCIIFNSIDQIGERNSLTIYPLPFEDQITIQSETPVTAVSLTSIEGREIEHRDFNNETQISFSPSHYLSSGVYLAVIQTTFGTTVVKLIHE